MSEKVGLSHTAYGHINGDDYVPYVPLSQAVPELTVLSIVMGCILAAVFAAANTYLGLKIGLTIAAGVPAAILATTFYKGILKRNNILEVNLVQSMAEMGEALAGGLMMIMPAVIIVGMKLPLSLIITVGLLGGLLGLLFVIPLRRYLMVEEHGNLIYPEGMAAAEVMVSASAGGNGFLTMITGLGVGGVYKMLTEGFGIFKYEAQWTIKPLQSTVFGVDVMASLLGVGFIVGIEIPIYMFAGGVLAYLGVIPLIKFFGAGLTMVVYPGTELISAMSAGAVRSYYIKYMGAGAVAVGGVISIVKSLPVIIKSFKSGISGIGAKNNTIKKTDKDAPITWVIAGAILIFILVLILPNMRVGVVGGLMIMICAFFFSVVSARLVGNVGTSNNPVSGMTIASLLVIATVLKVMGVIGDKGMLIALLCGAMVCCAAAIAGGASQSLKPTFIVGGTPKYVEIGMSLAIVSAVVVIGFIILMLDKQYGIGSETVSAPQATMMAMIVKGIMNSQLPWVLIFIGVIIGVMCELLKIPVLPFALGFYLPIHMSAGLVAGGAIRALIEKKYRNDETVLKVKVEKGILLGSGLVAGDALFGILIAIFAFANIQISELGTNILPKIITNNVWITTIMGIAFAFWIYKYVVKAEKNE